MTRFVCAGLVLCLPVMIGCGTQAVSVVPAEGIVYIDDEPAAGIMVNFSPKIVDEAISAVSSFAVTDENGKFVMATTKGEPGAMVGTHHVTLVDTLLERVEQGQERSQPIRLDPGYASAGQIEVEVVAGGDPIEIRVAAPN